MKKIAAMRQVLYGPMGLLEGIFDPCNPAHLEGQQLEVECPTTAWGYEAIVKATDGMGFETYWLVKWEKEE